MLTADNLYHRRYKLAIQLVNHACPLTSLEGRFSWNTGEVFSAWTYQFTAVLLSNQHLVKILNIVITQLD